MTDKTACLRAPERKGPEIKTPANMLPLVIEGTDLDLDMIFDMAEDENPLMGEDGEMDMIYEMLEDEIPLKGADGESIEASNSRDIFTNEGNLAMEPYVGMHFESEEAAKVFYDSYAKNVGFIMRVDAFRRSVDDGNVVWRRLVCNKQGFSKCQRPRRSENKKPRAIREGCKAMMSVKRGNKGKWVVQRFVKEHNHPLEVAPTTNHRRTITLSQTPDDKDAKIRELTAELQRERKKSAAIQQQLAMLLKDMEEHSNHLSRNINGIIQTVNEIESKEVVLPHRSSANEMLYGW